MLSEQQRAIIRATVPVLREHGETITREFYRQMFTAHPELLNLFNPASQRDGGQARSLAASILAYAAHIDDLGPLGGMVERIAQKHASLDVLPEHYPIVGEFLLRAIRAVLGPAATEEIIAAWAAAYGQLAEIMIGREAAIYTQSAEQPGGWRGFKPFRVVEKTPESETITSFTLAPADGTPLPPFRAGQYVSVRVQVPGAPTFQIRQYSLSCPPDATAYRISVKREDAPSAEAPAGLISQYLHAQVQAGDELMVHTPLGDFTLDESSTRPVVLLSGGAGVTPTLSMLYALAAQPGPREVVFIHAAPERGHHAFAEEVAALVRARPDFRSVVFYEQGAESLESDVHAYQAGRLHADALRPVLPSAEADYYVSGPLGFLAAVEAALDALRVPTARRHTEAFAPAPSFENLIAN